MTDRGTLLVCAGTILVHEDGSYTCTDEECEACKSHAMAMSRHAWFLACRDALGETCPVCQQARNRRRSNVTD